MYDLGHSRKYLVRYDYTLERATYLLLTQYA